MLLCVWPPMTMQAWSVTVLWVCMAGCEQMRDRVFLQMSGDIECAPCVCYSEHE